MRAARATLLALAFGWAMSATASAQEVVLYGAGSLREAMTEVTRDFTARTGIAVRTDFGPSGLIRERIEKVDLLTSADLGHPLRLRADGRATQVVMFTRSTLCVTAAPRVGMTADRLVDRLLDPAVRLATSTPRADPSGDYTWAMLELIEKVRPGAFAVLDAKARKLLGGTTTPLPADAPDPITAGFKNGSVDVSIGYCTSAARLKRAVPDLDIVEVPAAIRTGPEYGLALLKDADPRAAALAFYILSPDGQATLARHGFNPVALPTQAGS